MHHALQDLLRQATQLTQAGQLGAATRAIQQALGGLAGAGMQPPAAAGAVIDVQAVEVPDLGGTARAARPAPASFTTGVHRHGGLQRSYKLYLPPGAAGRALPLVVMLHGCTQDPDDFAAGTGMNAWAAAQGVAVLYPAQAQDANPGRCWNWFKHSHQGASRGEAALIASLARSVVQAHGLDAGRVFIAGLSAGGAMAALVAAAHPAQFAALGVHSGMGLMKAAQLAPDAAGEIKRPCHGQQRAHHPRDQNGTHRAADLRVERGLRAALKCKCGRTRLCVDDANVLHEDAALETGAHRLGEGFLCRKALRIGARLGERTPCRFRPFDVGEDTVGEAIAKTVE